MVLIGVLFFFSGGLRAVDGGFCQASSGTNLMDAIRQPRSLQWSFSIFPAHVDSHAPRGAREYDALSTLAAHKASSAARNLLLFPRLAFVAPVLSSRLWTSFDRHHTPPPSLVKFWPESSQIYPLPMLCFCPFGLTSLLKACLGILVCFIL